MTAPIYPESSSPYFSARKRDFISMLATGETARGAAARLGVNMAYFYNARKRDPDFAKAWATAMTEATEVRNALMKERNFNTPHGKTNLGPPPPGGKRVEPSYRQRFLAALAKGHSVTKAAEAADVAYGTVCRWRKEDPDFAAQWELALAQGVDRLEDEAFRRGVEGYDEPVFDRNGNQTGVIKRYSDPLLSLMLRAKIGHYRKTELPPPPDSGAGNTFIGAVNVLAVPPNHYLSAEDLAKIASGQVLEATASPVPAASPAEAASPPAPVPTAQSEREQGEPAPFGSDLKPGIKERNAPPLPPSRARARGY